MCLMPISVGLLAILAQANPPAPTPAPNPDLLASIGQIIQAWQGKQYVLVGALVIGLLIALSKTGWLGNWLANELPPKARPVVAVILGILTVTSTEIASGVDWKTAILHGIFAAATAVMGHDMLIEGLRRGKEIFPKKQTPGSTSGSGGGSNRDSIKTPPASPTVTRRSLMPVLAVFGVFITGCGAWWQEFLQNPVEQITKFIQYVQLFLDKASAIWAVIAPLLGDKAAQATTDFQAALTSAQDAAVAAHDAVDAAVAAQQPNIDIAAVMKPVQDAIAKVMDIIAQWRPASPPTLAARHDSLSRQATTIAHWRFR